MDTREALIARAEQWLSSSTLPLIGVTEVLIRDLLSQLRAVPQEPPFVCECGQRFPAANFGMLLHQAESGHRAVPQEPGWRAIDDGPEGAGGYVWVAYRNPHHPKGWNLRVQSTPIMPELGVEPEYWCPVRWPEYPVDPPAPAQAEDSNGR